MRAGPAPRRRGRALAGVLALAGAVALLAGPEARAADLQEASWWSRLATTDPLSESPQALPVPTPTTPATLPNPSVGDGQLLVEGTPEGAVAVAAIHWTLADGESSPTLTMPIAPGSSVNPQSVVLACRAAAPWQAPEEAPGRWESKPLTDPRACVNGIVADDLSTIAFGLQPLVNGDSLDVVLVPGTVADLPPEADGSAFRLVVDEPAPDALTVVPGDFDLGADPVEVTVPPATTTAGAPPAPIATAAPSVAGPPPSTSVATSFDAADDVPVVAAPALEPSDLAATVPRAVTGALAADVEGPSRFVGVVLLLAALGAAAWSWLSAPSPESAMIGLGRFRRTLPGAAATTGTAIGLGRFRTTVAGGAAAGSAEVPGGLSRFRRERSAPPDPVR